MTLRLFLLLALLSGCATGKPEDAGVPPPANYRSVVAGDFLQRFRGQYLTADASISAPQVGGRDTVTAWRVCVGATPAGGGDPVPIAYFFVSGHIKSATVGDVKCDGFAYEAWPEINDAEGWEN